MTTRSVRFDEFTIEKTYPAATPERVFFALSDEKAKYEWFGGPEQAEKLEQSMDFRVGGAEISAARWEGFEHRFVATYHDIVENARIVYSYELYVNGQKLSVSQTTIQLEAAGDGTKLTFTEHGAFLDGHEDPALRRHGTGELLDALGAYV